MMLLGQELQLAGLKFVTGKARYGHDGKRRATVVCETEKDMKKVDRWAKKMGYIVKTRLATPEELAEWQKWQEREAAWAAEDAAAKEPQVGSVDGVW